MSSLAVESGLPLATDVRISKDMITVALDDGRTIAAPITWYPRLKHATVGERMSWRLIGRGRGIHWPALDEDISVANLLAGQPSGESPISLKKWLSNRTPARSKQRRVRN